MLQMQRRSRMNFSRFRLFFLAFLALCAVAVTVHSQEHGKPPERPLSTSWGHKVWSTEDGLPQNSVHGILQTRDGYLWAATEGGVARFNGFQFTVFNQESVPEFTSNDTCCLAEDRNGDLWIGTSDGLLRYAGGAFRRYTTADGLPSAIVESLAPTDDGSLLVLTADGLARYEGQRFSALAPSASALGTGPGNAAWIAAAAGIFSYDNGHLRAASLPGLPGSIESLGSLKMVRNGPGLARLSCCGIRAGSGPGVSATSCLGLECSLFSKIRAGLCGSEQTRVLLRCHLQVQLGMCSSRVCLPLVPAPFSQCLKTGSIVCGSVRIPLGYMSFNERNSRRCLRFRVGPSLLLHKLLTEPSG